MPSRSATLQASVAASIDAPVPALPWIAEVFSDLGALGSSPRRIAQWLKDAGLAAPSSVLDLGCGKGAVAVEIARTVGCRVVGVDAFEPFIVAARALAERRDVADRCRFVVDNARLPRSPRVTPLTWARSRVDAALMVGLFPVDEAVATLRPLVRPGGMYLVDDCIDIRPDGTPDAPLSQSEARSLLEQRGDIVLREHVPTPSRVRAIEASLLARMTRRIESICKRESAARGPLRELLRRQRAAAGQLAGRYRPAMWLVRRGRS